MNAPLTLSAETESWPIAGEFVISRGAKREAIVVVATLRQQGRTGRGECVPYARYGHSPEATLAELQGLRSIPSREAIQRDLAPGPARNALDCALWDLEAKRAGHRAYELAGLTTLHPVLTCYTLSLGASKTMAAKASAMAHLPLLKLKLGGGAEDIDRMHAVRNARPDARLLADANESWQPADLERLLNVAAETGFELIEQPLRADHDQQLAVVPRPVPVCADESAHTRAGLDALCDRYDAVNIKLDKTGGLTEALAMARHARTLGLKIMVGSMVSTSLAIAPASLVAQSADWADLDGPLLLARDRTPGLQITNGRIQPPDPELWG